MAGEGSSPPSGGGGEGRPRGSTLTESPPVDWRAAMQSASSSIEENLRFMEQLRRTPTTREEPPEEGRVTMTTHQGGRDVVNLVEDWGEG